VNAQVEGADVDLPDDILASKDARIARDTVIAFVRNMANVDDAHKAVSAILMRAIKREIPD
jgi:hypothetical protein